RGGETVCLVAVLKLFREFDDEDGVLASESDEHNEADLREDVVFHRAEPDTVDRAEQTHRDNENDCEGQRPAFVKGREQKKNEQNTERENENRAIAGELLLQRYLGPFGGNAGRKHLFGD